METIIYCILTFIAGGIITYIFAKAKFDSPEFQEKAEALEKYKKIIEGERNELVIKLAKAEERVENARTAYNDLKTSITSMGETYKIEFKNVANEILDQKSKSLEETSTKNIKTLLDPLNKDLKDFKEKVDKVYSDEARERHSLEGQVKRLVDSSAQVSQQAENLTNALKGNVKQQGNWGEMILSSILENSGLTENREYFLQEFIKDKSGEIIKDENGNGLQPDVTIHYPDERKVIVDSKVSLVAWERYMSETDTNAQKQALEAHIKSLKAHIDGLSKKNYPKYAKALDHVILFVPIEPAFLEAVKQDTGLWKYAYDKKVLIVGPTNLLLVLKIVADIWQIEKQSKNAIEIAEKAGELYDKLLGFVESMEDVGAGLKKANQNYEKAMGQLSTGKGNAIKKAEELKGLGADT
ncbi:MAG: DNA recombination protein RmuC, partial [Proteobacteria bacterium]|nr:DNA recombination protein RmuC [Pseudomonadota bacterium]